MELLQNTESSAAPVEQRGLQRDELCKIRFAPLNLKGFRTLFLYLWASYRCSIELHHPLNAVLGKGCAARGPLHSACTTLRTTQSTLSLRSDRFKSLVFMLLFVHISQSERLRCLHMSRGGMKMQLQAGGEEEDHGEGSWMQ